MTIQFKLSILIALSVLLGGQTYGQCDSIATLCGSNIPSDYISDGQSYRAFLTDDQVAEFRTTLFAGTDYRVAACSGFEPTNIRFRVLDENRKVLFSNDDFDLLSYWNFRAENTMDCIIEAELNGDAVSSGCAVILISFAR
jgi:hypothetical protein